MSNYEDLTGEKFGNYLVLKEVDGGDGRKKWECKCTLCNKTSNVYRYPYIYTLISIFALLLEVYICKFRKIFFKYLKRGGVGDECINEKI